MVCQTSMSRYKTTKALDTYSKLTVLCFHVVQSAMRMMNNFFEDYPVFLSLQRLHVSVHKIDFCPAGMRLGVMRQRNWVILSGTHVYQDTRGKMASLGPHAPEMDGNQIHFVKVWWSLVHFSSNSDMIVFNFFNISPYLRKQERTAECLWSNRSLKGSFSHRVKSYKPAI